MASRTQTRTPRPAAKNAAPATSSAVAVLVEDNREVEALFVKFEELGRRAHKRREAVVAKMMEALSTHASIEETVSYPDVRTRVAAAPTRPHPRSPDTPPGTFVAAALSAPLDAAASVVGAAAAKVRESVR